MNKRTMIRTVLFAASFVWVTGSISYGQWYVGPQYGVGGYRGYGYGGVGYGGVGYGGGYGLGYGLGYGMGAYGSPQTPYSAEAIGMGELIRAEGDYNKRTSEAVVNYEQARAQYIDNQQKAIAARQTSRRLAQAEDTKDQQAAQASRARAEQFISTHKPQPLSYRQLDPANGRILWPTALSSPDFEPFRKPLDSLFEARLKSGPTPNLVAEIGRRVGELRDALRARILEIPLSEYSEARRFLDSLSVSAN